MKDAGADRNAGFYPADSQDREDDSAVDVLERTERPASPPRPAAKPPAATPPAARAPVQETTPAPPAAEAPKVEDKAKSQPEPAPKTRRRRAILALAFLGLLGAGSYYGYHWWTVGRFLVSTDDAYVKADMSVIASKVTGYVADVPITDNQHMHAGDLLAKIDDADYRVAVEAAQRKAATQDATIVRLKEQAKAQNAMIEQAKAQLVSAEAGQVRASADFDRAEALAQSSYGSRQNLDQARAGRDQAVASVAAARAAQLSAEANLSVLNAQVVEAVHVRAELQSNLDQANLNFGYTSIRAPFDGVVGNKAVQRGQYVQPGSRLLSLVPLDTVYVEANYKETQLDGLKPGQTVDVYVDAADDHKFEGVVESIAPASGSQFSLLPPENATGNFTKIVQRVPVRIRVSGDAVKAGVLRPGLSVVTYIHTKADETPQQSAQNTAATGAQAAPAR